MQVASSWLGLESLRKGPPRAPSSLPAREVRFAEPSLPSLLLCPCHAGWETSVPRVCGGVPSRAPQAPTRCGWLPVTSTCSGRIAIPWDTLEPTGRAGSPRCPLPGAAEASWTRSCWAAESHVDAATAPVCPPGAAHLCPGAGWWTSSCVQDTPPDVLCRGRRGGVAGVSGRQPGSFRPRPGLPVGLQQEPLGPGRDREDAGQSARAATSTHHRSGLQNAGLLPRSPGGWTSKVKGPPPWSRESSLLARRRPPLCAHQLRGPGDLRPHP